MSVPKGIKFVGHPGKHHLTRKKCVAPGEATAHFYSTSLFWTGICQYHRLVRWILHQWVIQIFHRNSITNQKKFRRYILGYFLNSIEGVNLYAGQLDQKDFRIMRNKFSCLVFINLLLASCLTRIVYLFSLLFTEGLLLQGIANILGNINQSLSHILTLWLVSACNFLNVLPFWP